MGWLYFSVKVGPFGVAILFAVLWFFIGNPRKLILLEATWSAVLGLAVNQVIGLFYFHPRPCMIGLGDSLFPHGPETSFPSDHATVMFAVAFYLLLAQRWAAYSIPLLAVALLTAWGRVYNGIHFPFDMAGNVVVGLVSVGLTRLAEKPLNPLNERLIRMVDQRTDRLVRIKKRTAKEK